MNEIKDGGMAFPDPGRAQSAKQRQELTETGMTLRDYFAAKAMQGISSHPDTWGQVIEGIAKEAYAIADAMLKARES